MACRYCWDLVYTAGRGATGTRTSALRRGDTPDHKRSALLTAPLPAFPPRWGKDTCSGHPSPSQPGGVVGLCPDGRVLQQELLHTDLGCLQWRAFLPLPDEFGMRE
jgi:hypothetical protein